MIELDFLIHGKVSKALLVLLSGLCYNLAMVGTAFNFAAAEIAELEKRSVGALVLFGSQAQSMAGPASDFDIAVLVNDKKLLFNPEKRKAIYDFLYDFLSPKIGKLADIDIVFLETAPAELQAHVMKYGQVLFQSEENVFADFRERVMIQCADFAPLQAIFHSGILSRIP